MKIIESNTLNDKHNTSFIASLFLRMVQIDDFARSETLKPFLCFHMIFFLTSVVVLTIYLTSFMLSLAFLGPMVAYGIKKKIEQIMHNSRNIAKIKEQFGAGVTDCDAFCEPICLKTEV